MAYAEALSARASGLGDDGFLHVAKACVGLRVGGALADFGKVAGARPAATKLDGDALLPGRKCVRAGVVLEQRGRSAVCHHQFDAPMYTDAEAGRG